MPRQMFPVKHQTEESLCADVAQTFVTKADARAEMRATQLRRGGGRLADFHLDQPRLEINLAVCHGLPLGSTMRNLYNEYIVVQTLIPVITCTRV